MRNFLAFPGRGAFVAFLGVGYYLGWYKIDREPSEPPALAAPGGHRSG